MYLGYVHEVIVHKILLDFQCNLDRLFNVATKSWWPGSYDNADSYAGGSLHCLKALYAMPSSRLDALYTRALIAYLHLRYLGDCQHAADEEARENIIMHQILSHPDLHLSVQDSRSDERKKTSVTGM